MRRRRVAGERKKASAVVAVTAMLLVLLCGCEFITMDTSEVFDVNGPGGHSLEIQQARMDAVKRDGTEDLLKHYGNGLYNEDLNEVRQQFSQAYQQKIEGEAKSHTKNPLIVKTKAEFYNQSLKAAKEGTLTFEQAMADPSKHLRNVTMELYLFCTPEEVKPNTELKNYLKDLHFSYTYAGIYDNGEYLLTSDQSVLSEVSLEEIAEQEYPHVFLDDYKVGLEWLSIGPDAKECYFRETRTVYAIDSSWSRKTIDALRERYNVDFVQGWDDYVILKNDPLVEFYSEFTSSKFLTAYAQKVMGDHINRIIYEEGAADYIAQYTAPRSLNSADEQVDTRPYDISKIKTEEDEVAFLQSGYPGTYDTSLIYLKEPDAPINYEVLYRVTSRIRTMMPIEPHYKQGMIVFIYTLPAQDHKMICDLFRKDIVTDNYFEYREGGIENVYKNMKKIYEDTDGFNYVTLFGQKENYVMKISINPKEQTGESFEEIMKSYMRKDIFGGKLDD